MHGDVAIGVHCEGDSAVSRKLLRDLHGHVRTVQASDKSVTQAVEVYDAPSTVYQSGS